MKNSTPKSHGCLVTVMVLALSSAAGTTFGEPERLDLQVADVLARPGDPVELVARLEKSGPRGVNIPDVDVEFRLDGRTVGTKKTDERGLATFPVTAPALGDHVVKVVFAGDSRYLRSEYLGLLAVRRESEPILIVNVDWTLAMTDNLNTSRGGTDCPPYANASEVMERLAKKYTIVYVTGRARQLRKRTISWLFRYGFPRGPSYYLNPSDYPTYDVVGFKKSILGPMAQKFQSIRVGVGNGPDDLEAYRASGLKPLLVGGNPVSEVTCVPDWTKVEAALSTLQSNATTKQ